MSIAKFNDETVPYVYAIIVDREFVGDRVRLAKGKMRQDITAVKRTWNLETRVMQSSEADSIKDTLEDNSWQVDFWLDEFGDSSNTVTAFVNIGNEERIQFGARDGSGWQNDGKQFEFEIIEQ